MSSVWKRRSTISSRIDSEEKIASRASGATPRLKKGGGEWPTTDITMGRPGNAKAAPALRRFAPYRAAALLVSKNTAEFVHLFEGEAGAAHHAGQRVVADQDRQARFFHQQAVEVAQQGAAAGQDHALLGDVGAEFRRGVLEADLDRADDLIERIG